MWVRMAGRAITICNVMVVPNSPTVPPGMVTDIFTIATAVGTLGDRSFATGGETDDELAGFCEWATGEGGGSVGWNLEVRGRAGKTWKTRCHSELSKVSRSCFASLCMTEMRTTWR